MQPEFVAQACLGAGAGGGGVWNREPAISLLLLKETFSKANRLSREAKPSAAEFNVLIKMLKRLYSRMTEAVIALSS